MTEAQPTRSVRISSKYIPLLAPFVANGDIRYYLDGIFVSPHEEEGIYLVATDGHTMCVIHDSEGKTNGDWICGIPGKIIKACKKFKRSNKDPIGMETPGTLAMEGDGLYVICEAANVDDMDVTQLSRLHLEVAHEPPIDGVYPEWKKVIHNPSGEGHIVLNLDYLSNITPAIQLARAGKGHAPCHVFCSEHKGMIYRVGGLPEYIALIMPMRDTETKAMPDWLRLPKPTTKKTTKAA